MATRLLSCMSNWARTFLETLLVVWQRHGDEKTWTFNLTVFNNETISISQIFPLIWQCIARN